VKAFFLILDKPSALEALNQKLIDACRDGNLAKVKSCLEHGAEINSYGMEGHPPLFLYENAFF